MAASADKVQYILETTLEQSIPLVKKGIFSQLELKQIMHRRQKMQNNMLKKAYALTDYLGAIEYEYELERQRKSRMDQMSKLEQGQNNPSFRKESSSDFAIVKRIFRLWDRTMHKYKFKIHLWKQYLKFCITVGSKKHFYKALTNALRFLPFQTDLWKIGAEYEKEVGRNLWKGRKLLIKAMKMVPAGEKNIQIGHFMLRYEMNFLTVLLQRREILTKGEEVFKLIGDEELSEQAQEKAEKEKMDNIDLSEYHNLLWTIVEEIFNKNQNNLAPNLTFDSIKGSLLELLSQLAKGDYHSGAKETITKTIAQLKKTKSIVSGEIPAVKIEQSMIIAQEKFEEMNAQSEYDDLAIGDSNLNVKKIELLIRKKCLRPTQLAQLFEQMFDINLPQSVDYLAANKAVRPPSATTYSLIYQYNRSSDYQLSRSIKSYIEQAIDRLQPKDFRANLRLLAQVTKFNSNQDRLRVTTKIMRSITIIYKAEPEFLQSCNRIVNEAE